MRIVTVIALVVAIIVGSVALMFKINTPNTPLAPNYTAGNVDAKVEDEDILNSISSHSFDAGSIALIETIEDGVYRRNDYSQFYCVSGSGFSEIEDIKRTKITVSVSNELCELEIIYVEIDGRVVGGGTYEKVIEKQGIYSIELKLTYTLTEIPSALEGNEGEKLLLVGFSADDYYSEAFAIDLNDGHSRNMFSQAGRAVDNSDGYVMLTDELVKNSGEYLYFFSSRLYDRESEGSRFNKYKSIDLFRTKAGDEELVARQVHHRYVSDADDGNICFIRSEYATLTYTVGSAISITFQELNFKVIHLDFATMEETVVMQSSVPYSSGYNRFGNYLIKMSDERYGTLEVFDMAKNESSLHHGLGMRSVLCFDVSSDGRYIAVGGSVSVASTVNQNICFIDTQSGQMVTISGKDLFLAINGNFAFIDSEYFVNASYDADETNITFYVTKINKIMETFKESVDDL